ITLPISVLIDESCVAAIVHVVASALTVRSILPIAGYGAIDNARIHSAAGVIPDDKSVHDAGTECFDHRICITNQPKKNLHALVLFQIKTQGPLVAVFCGEHGCELARKRAERARIVASAGIFDFDDISAKVGQVQGADRSRKQPGQIQNANARERFGAHRRLIRPLLFWGRYKTPENASRPPDCPLPMHGRNPAARGACEHLARARAAPVTDRWFEMPSWQAAQAAPAGAYSLWCHRAI